MSTPRAARRRTHLVTMVVVAVVGAGAVVGVPTVAAAAVRAAPLLVPVVESYTEPAVPRLGQEFRVSFTVTAGGLPVPDTLVAVTFAGGSPVAVPLVDGGYSAAVLVTEPSTYTVRLDYPGSAGIDAASGTYTHTFALTAQTITFPQPTSPVSVLDGPVPLAATVDTGHPVSYAVTGPCSLAGATVVLDGYGDCVVTASQEGSEGFAAALPVERTITITGLAQAIRLDAVLPAAAVVGGPAVQLPLTSSAGLAVSYTTDAGCSVDAATGLLTFLAEGDCAVAATATGSPLYPEVTESGTVAVGRVAAELTITVLTEEYGHLEALITGAAGGAPLAYATVTVRLGGSTWDISLGADGTVLIGVSGGVSGPQTLQVEYPGSAATAPATASVALDLRDHQSIALDAALPDLAPVVTTVALPTETSEHLPVTSISTTPAVCTVSGSTLTLVGPGTCSVESSNPGDATRSAVLVGVSFTVTRRPQTIELRGPAPTRTGAGIHSVRAQSSVGLPVTISVSGPACRYDGNLSFVDVGECVVTASSPGDALTEPASASLRTVVTTGPQYTELHLTGGVGDLAAGLPVWGWLGTGRPGTATILSAESTPVVLAQAVTAWDGGGLVRGVLPALGAGTHHLVITGTSLDGSPVRAELAFGVGADGRITWIGRPGARGSLPATGPDVDGTVPLAVLLLVGGVGLLGVRRRLVAGGAR